MNIFSKTGEVFFIFTLEDDDIYSELNIIGRQLCFKHVEGNSSFYLLDSVHVQSTAIHDYQIFITHNLHILDRN